MGIHDVDAVTVTKVENTIQEKIAPFICFFDLCYKITFLVLNGEVKAHKIALSFQDFLPAVVFQPEMRAKYACEFLFNPSTEVVCRIFNIIGGADGHDLLIDGSRDGLIIGLFKFDEFSDGENPAAHVADLVASTIIDRATPPIPVFFP